MSSTVPLGTTEEACDFRPAMGFKGTLVIQCNTHILYGTKTNISYTYYPNFTYIYMYNVSIYYICMYIYIHTSIHLSIDQESYFPSIKLLQQ